MSEFDQYVMQKLHGIRKFTGHQDPELCAALECRHSSIPKSPANFGSGFTVRDTLRSFWKGVLRVNGWYFSAPASLGHSLRTVQRDHFYLRSTFIAPDLIDDSSPIL
jgi:hypothetical protein